MKTNYTLVRLALAFVISMITIVSPGQKPVSSGQTIEGEWTGIVKAPGMELRMNLYISRDGQAYTSKWDSPDQGSYGKQSTKTTFSFPDLFFSYEEASFEVHAKVDSSYTTIRGQMNQRDRVFPVELQRKPAVPATGSTAILDDKSSPGRDRL